MAQEQDTQPYSSSQPEPGEDKSCDPSWGLWGWGGRCTITCEKPSLRLWVPALFCWEVLASQVR